VGSFFIIQKLLKFFINMGRYNLVYGVLSNLIVLLLEVFIFFQIFLFFAQYIYVNQFFETLLLGELYLLPKRENQALIPRTKRILFIKPSKLVNKPENVIWVKKGEIIYEAGKYDTSVYYITSGIAEITTNNRVELVTPASFIGEISAFLDIPREATVTAKSDLQLVKIKEAL
jgi:membrane protein